MIKVEHVRAEESGFKLTLNDDRYFLSYGDAEFLYQRLAVFHPQPKNAVRVRVTGYLNEDRKRIAAELTAMIWPKSHEAVRLVDISLNAVSADFAAIITELMDEHNLPNDPKLWTEAQRQLYNGKF